MIASLSGKITARQERTVILDVGGVGFEVYVSTSTLEALAGKTDAKLFTHLHVREDAFELYGFLTRDEHDFFQQLLKVRDVGPKSAIGILSVGSVADMKKAIAQEDAAVLMQVSGIGRKTADRIILELKGKVGLPGDHTAAGDGVVLSALERLGYSQREARDALHQVSREIRGEDDRLKAALKALGGKR